MRLIEIYTKDWCSYCAAAKQVLDARGVPYHEIDVTTDTLAYQEMVERSRHRSAPQAFIGSRHLGGHDDLLSLDAAGELQALATAHQESLATWRTSSRSPAAVAVRIWPMHPEASLG